MNEKRKAWLAVYSSVLAALVAAESRLDWVRMRERATIEANLALISVEKEAML